MIISDQTSLAEFLDQTWQVINGVLSFESEAYQFILNAPNGGRLALFILILASISYTIGQIVVLFANRVDRSHFLSGLVGASLTLIGAVFFWALSIWLIAVFFFGGQQPILQVFYAVAISFAPLIYGFTILAPYLGNIIFYILKIWVFLAVIAGTAVTFEFGFWQALICSVFGWIVLELLTRIPFLQINRISNWLWRVSTRTEKQLDSDEIVAQFVDEANFSGDESES